MVGWIVSGKKGANVVVDKQSYGGPIYGAANGPEYECALFAGGGGGILGAALLGERTVCAVEIEPYPASVLCARQNDGIFPPFPVWDVVCNNFFTGDK